MKLYLVRHGESTGNRDGNMIGWSDHLLSPLGREQARAVADRLKPLGPMPVYCSDLMRARATAEAILAMWGPSASEACTFDERLREVSLGDYEDVSWSEFVANDVLAKALDENPCHTVFPGGESVADLRMRVLEAVAAIRSSGVEVACLVAHDGPIRAVIGSILGIPDERWWVPTTTHCGLSLVEWSDGWVNLRFFNDTAHLGDPDIAGPPTDTAS